MSLALHTHHAASVLCTLLYIVAVVASVAAAVFLLASLLGRPFPWLPAAVVAVISWLILLFLC